VPGRFLARLFAILNFSHRPGGRTYKERIR
jgi:hypothetical protein